MGWLKSITREVFGLFVEDGSFAISILAWVVVAVVLLPRIAQAVRWAGPALFAGLAVILIESVLRYSRRRMK
jgi:hypothetical protein